MKHGEKFNTVTHLLATILAFPGMVYLIYFASETADPWKINQCHNLWYNIIFSIFIINYLSCA